MMKEERLRKIAEKEVHKVKDLYKRGLLPPQFVSFEVILETVLEDYHVPAEQHAQMEALLREQIELQQFRLPA